MSQSFHVWYAQPLPWDVESGQAHWLQACERGVHEPRLVRCVERLQVLLQAYEPDTIWTEEPEANEPCATLALAPMTGSLELVAEAIAKAAAELGLCVFNPFDGSVWLPDGRVLQRLALALAPMPAPSGWPVAPATTAATAWKQRCTCSRPASRPSSPGWGTLTACRPTAGPPCSARAQPAWFFPARPHRWRAKTCASMPCSA